jgi:hypothetical protein
MRLLFKIVFLGYVMWLIVPGCTPPLHHFSREVLELEDESSSMDSAFQQDVSECQRASVTESNREAMMGTAHVMFFERDMNRCLEAKGWMPTRAGDYTYRFDEWMEEAMVVK